MRAHAEDREVSMAWLTERAVTKFLAELIPVDEIQWTRKDR